MNCFPCFQSQRSKKSASKNMTPSNENEFNSTAENQKDQITQVENGNIAAQTFTFRELATATKNFRQECLLGEGGFGRVYKGMLKASGEVVAVKQLDRNGLQGNKEFLVEVFMLSLLHHQNLVNLIGYCADGDQRLLVFDFVPGGSLDYHLLDTTTEQKPLDWKTRMKIAYGAAKGLEYLHDKANPPVIYRDLKSSNILLDEEFNAKLSDFGLGKFGHAGDKMPVQSRVMGTYGYCAPEYARSGHLTTKSDVYSFGVVLLELITGRRAVDTTKPIEEQNLVAWAQPIFRDPKKFPDMADPRLNKQFPIKSLNQAVAIAAMCLQEEAAARPLMSDVVTTLSFLKTAVEEIPAFVTPPLMNEGKNEGKNKDPEGSEKDQDQESSDHEDGESENHSDDEDPDRNSSNYTDTDGSVYEDGESEDGHQQAVAESKKWSSKSSRKSSRRSQDRRVSSGHKDSSDESVSSSDTSSRVSRDRSLNQKGIKKYFSLSRKSSKGSKDGSVSLGHMSSMKSSIFSLSHKSSKISQDGNASFSYNSSRGSPSSRKSSLRLNSSKGSHDGRGSLSHKSSMRSQNESIMFDHNSSGKSQDGDVCLEHNDSRGDHGMEVFIHHEKYPSSY